MENEEILKQLQKERIRKLRLDLEIIKENQPEETSKIENDLYLHIGYLLDDITYFLYEN